MQGLVADYDGSSSSSGDEISVDEYDKSEEAPSVFRRLGKCEVCAAKDAAYSCPKCEVKTCSLPCVRIHKKELNCDGIRDRTKFLPIREMTEMDYQNDYYFLEECTRFVADRKYDKNKRFTRFNKALPPHLFRLRGAALKREVNLRFLLQNFSRHRTNSTCYNRGKDKILWHVEWVFVSAGGVKYVDKRCDEDTPLCQLLDKYVNPSCAISVPKKKDLAHYQRVGASGLTILLKAEGIKRSSTRFHSLDAAKSLRDNLRGKNLVEFPSIYLSCEAQPAGFDVITKGEDITAETRQHEEALEEKRRRQRQAMLEKQNGSSDEETQDPKKLPGVSSEQEKEKKPTKPETLRTSQNFLFADESSMEMLSSSDSEGVGNKEGTEEADLYSFLQL